MNGDVIASRDFHFSIHVLYRVFPILFMRKYRWVKKSSLASKLLQYSLILGVQAQRVNITVAYC